MADAKVLPCKRGGDGGRWTDLPLELRERIVALLPISHLLRLRSVCKDWNSIISSSTFLTHYHNPNPNPNPSSSSSSSSSLHHNRLSHHHQHHHQHEDEEWLLVYACDKIFAYIPSFSRWVHLDLTHALLLFPEGSYVRGLVAAGGLLCLYSYNLSLYSRSFVVCNPLSKDRRLLPLLPMSSAVTTWTMVVDERSKSFKVMVLNMSTAALLHVYASESSQWIQISLSQGTAPAQGHRDIFFRVSASCISRVVYCVDCTQRSVFAYDIEKDDWSKLDAPFPRGFGISKENIFIFPRVVQGSSTKKLMLVGGLIQGGIIESIGVLWELDIATMTWCEVSRAPDHMWKEMLECCYLADEFPIRVEFAGGRNLISVTMAPCCQVLVYDIHKKLWHKLPNLPLPYLESAATYFYQPRLDAQLI